MSDPASPPPAGDSFLQRLAEAAARMPETDRRAFAQSWPLAEPVIRLIERRGNTPESGESILHYLAREAAGVLRRPGYQNEFRALLAADPNVIWRLLDIG